MAETKSRTPISEIAAYRSALATRLVGIAAFNREAAKDLLYEVRPTPAFQVARSLYKDPERLLAGDSGVAPQVELTGGERRNFGYYRSNEYYAHLAPRLKDLGGVGIVVGSDQPLDFLTMANLSQVYAVDIDPNTHIMTRGYLEIGTRFRQLLGRYPTTDEYVTLFELDNLDATLGMLAAESTSYEFSQANIHWLREQYTFNRGENSHFGQDGIDTYLRQKRTYYGDAGWIGSDQNLANVIKAYEQGRITICQGSVEGTFLPTIARKVSQDGENVSVIYVSNAPISNDRTLHAFQKLPLTDKSLVVFSKSEHGYNETPRGYQFDLGWSHFVFSPLDHSYWPKSHANETEVDPLTDGSPVFLGAPKANLFRW